MIAPMGEQQMPTFEPTASQIFKYQMAAKALVISLVFGASPAWAVGSVLSGLFDGSEPAVMPLTVMPLEELECTEKPKGYLQIPFEVSAGGTYHFKNAFGQTIFNSPTRLGVGVTALIYERDFDVTAPEKNLIASVVFNWLSKRVNLTEGTPYILVVQQWCAPWEGVWAVTFTGPGTINSDLTAAVPWFTSGRVTADDPITMNSCLSWWDIYQSRYEHVGPFQVSRDGLYYFADASASELCVTFFTAPFNPDDWSANYLTSVGDGTGPVRLEAGQDYYYIAQVNSSIGTGEYFFVLAPPAPFRINPGLNDSWYNPATPGQGFFLEVMDQLNQVFLGWFSFSEVPSASEIFNHRWLTALGPFSGTSADLSVEWTSGGAFDATEPAPLQYQDGVIELEFTDCNTGQILFSWDGEDGDHPPQSGAIPIERITNDSIDLCESLFRGPGLPGPL